MPKSAHKPFAFALLLVFLFFGIPKLKTAGMSGYFSGVSSYVFRGIKVYDGVALQGSIDGYYKFLSIGVWYSTVNFGANSPTLEIDPYLGLNFRFSDYSIALGITNYMYDLSNIYDKGSYEYELFGKLSWQQLTVSAYYVPAQSSTRIYHLKSFYWIELGIEKAFLNINWKAQLSYGSYPIRTFSAVSRNATTQVLFSGDKTLNELVSVNWNYSQSIDSQSSDYFWFGIVFNY